MYQIKFDLRFMNSLHTYMYTKSFNDLEEKNVEQKTDFEDIIQYFYLVPIQITNILVQ